MEKEDITREIIGCAYNVHNKLGFGFLESVYKKAMEIELSDDKLKAEAEKHLRVYYYNHIVGEFSVDLFIEDLVVVELKAVQNLMKEHEAQLASVGVSTSEYADAPSASGQDEEAAQ